MPIHDADFADALKIYHTPESTVGFEVCAAPPKYRLHVWHREARPGHLEFRARGQIPGMDPTMFTTILEDLEYRPVWDEYTKEARAAAGADHTFYWVAKYPWPMDDREYVYERDTREYEDGVRAIFHRSVELGSEPVRKGHTRVTNYSMLLVYGPGPDGSTRFAMRHAESPGGSSSVVSAVTHLAASGVVSYFKNLIDAATNYPVYLDTKSSGGKKATDLVVEAIDKGLAQAFAGAF